MTSFWLCSCSAHVEFEHVLLKDVEVRLRIFAPLLCFMVYLSRHIYGGLEPTPQRHLTFATSCVGTWLLSVLLSNFANLHHGSEKKLLALESCIVDLPASSLKNALQYVEFLFTVLLFVTFFFCFLIGILGRCTVGILFI